jgi:hypothetical protein
LNYDLLSELRTIPREKFEKLEGEQFLLGTIEGEKIGGETEYKMYASLVLNLNREMDLVSLTDGHGLFDRGVVKGMMIVQ